MMEYFLLLSLVLLIAVTINCASVYIQKRYQFYDRFSHGWTLHTLAIVPAWVTFIYLASMLNEHTRLNFPTITWIGIVMSVLAAALFALAIKQIGTQALSNGNFFGKGAYTNKGVYGHLKNPIYDSYWLVLVGAGIYFGNWAYVLLAAECYICLNVIETRVEKVTAVTNFRNKRGSNK